MQPPYPAQAANPIRTHPRSFQVHATKVFRSIRSKFGIKSSTKHNEMEGPFKRQTRSLDVRMNTFMSQPVLGLQIETGPTDGLSSRTASSSSNSPIPLVMSSWDTIDQPSVRHVRTASMPAKPPLQNDTSTTDPLSASVRVPDIVVSESRTQAESNLNNSYHQIITPSPLTQNTPMTAPRTANTSALLSSDTLRRPNSRSQLSTTPAENSLSNRPNTLHIADMPPPAFQISREGSVRLSPSIIARPAHRPILQLPRMPAPSASPDPRPSRPHSRLRSMPALSVDGTNELDRDGDHEDAGTGDSDEDDEGEENHGGSDEETEEHVLPMSSESSRSDLRAMAPTRKLPDLPPIATTPFESSSPNSKPSVAGPPASGRREGDITPTASNVYDYFTAKPQPGPSGTPRVNHALTRPATSNGASMHRALPPLTVHSGLSRPAIYHHVSKSMVNLLSPKQDMFPAKDLFDGKKIQSKSNTPAQPDMPSRPAPEEAEGNGLRRRRSMPVFNATSDPPPYPTFARRDNVAIMPRDDEGMECLPEYSNSIHLTAIMPRKMEFSAPGIQAKDRKWRRTLCELEGTVFRVYKCPPGAVGGGVIGGWWEKTVGVGNVTASGGASGSTIKDVPPRATDTPSKVIPDSDAFSTVPISSVPSGSRSPRDSQTHAPAPAPTPVQKPRRLTSTLLHPITRGGSSPSQSRPHMRSHSDATMPSSETQHRSSLNISRVTTRSSSHLSSSFVSSSNQSVSVSIPSPNSSPPPSATRSNFFHQKPNGRNSANSITRSCSDTLCPDPADLIRVYTLQNAESGLGNDYLKRKNVIRVRMEGEQFLLQAQDVAEVVEWIEALHAATNIALDLDERIMPKGPMFPRRRRRRRRPEADEANPATLNRPAQS